MTIKEITNAVRAVINTRTEEITDEEVLSIIEDFVLHDSRTKWYPYAKKIKLTETVFNITRRELDILQPYADDNEVSEIMVNGAKKIFVERNGKIEKLPILFEDREDLEEIIRRLAAKVHREINELTPIVDARLEDGSRINAVYRNVALNGPILTIRKFPKKKITMEELILKDSISEEASAFLKKLVRSGYNIFISGGTSSGKTTFLNVLSDCIPREERVIVIEDSAELQITKIDNVVRMETKNANVQGKGEVTVRDLIKASLRMRPDRIIVGEVRGGEVVDMIQAMNTGHDGSLSTGHGNSPEGMLRRLEAMFLSAADFPMEAIRSQILEAIDIIVHLGRLPNKSRKILQIVEIAGYKNEKYIINPLFQYQISRGLIATGNPLNNQIKLEMRGGEL